MRLSRVETAKRIGISLRTLDRHIAAGKLTAEKTEPDVGDPFKQCTFIPLESIGK